MTTQSDTSESYLVHRTSLDSWLRTTDHKRLGLMYLGAALSAFALALVLALLGQAELATSGVLDATTFEQMSKAHDVIMLFLVLVPAIPAGLGNFFLPLVLGARSVAFPRLHLVAFHLYAVGAMVTLAGVGSLDAEWSFEMAYVVGEQAGTAVLALFGGLTLLAMSSVLTSIGFIVTIHQLRAPRVSWSRVPVFAWSLYATALAQIFAAPVLGLTLILLVAERTFGTGIFDPALGGDPLLFQHFFWFYTHPAIVTLVIPALGVVTEIVATFSRREVFGAPRLAGALFALAGLSFLGWGSHMFTSGMSEYASLVFGAMSLLAVVPSLVAIFHLLATMSRGAIALEPAMLWAMGFVAMFTLGTVANVFLSLPAVAIHLEGTSFSLAHLHVMVGAVVLALVAGLLYWWPKMTGRMVDPQLARLGFALVTLGMVVGFAGQAFAGAHGMPGWHHADFLTQYETARQVAFGGALASGMGFALVALGFVRSLSAPHADAGPNPWSSRGYEWSSASPPSPEGFDAIPTFDRGPYEYED